VSEKSDFFDGGCTCGGVRYRLTSEPLFVHCCHCSWCQRETGSAFAVNALIEADRVELLQQEPQLVKTPSKGGKGQDYYRCAKCRVAVWSNYAGAGIKVRFIRAGTLDEPGRLPPDVHIFVSSKLPLVVIPDGVPSAEEFYDRRKLWPAESLARAARLK
jgi:hypothetical protein